MTYTDKSGFASFQENLSKRNEINRQSLIRELSKLREAERRDARIIDIAKQRFRSRCKKLGVGPVVSSNCKVTDVRMYETHNPGFCYHCNGAIKDTDSGSFDRPIVNEDDSYEYVRAMLFTDGQLDPEKLLCLHLLTAHTFNEIEPRVPETMMNFSSGFGRGTSEGNGRSNGAWNDLLPCYVIEIENGSSRMKSQVEMPRASPENAAGMEKLRDFELSYEIRGSDGAARSTEACSTVAKMAAGQRREMAITSYEFAPRETCILEVENPSKDDFRRLDNVSVASYHTGRAIHSACASDQKTFVTSSLCGKIDRSLTMLKKKSERNFPEEDVKRRAMKPPRGKSITDDLITIKSSLLSLENSSAKNAQANWPRNRQLPGSLISSTSSRDLATTEAPRRCAIVKFHHRVYLNLPIRSFALDDRDYRVVDILVNDHIKILVRSILRVLERLNPDKIRWILETSGDRKKIRELFAREDMQKFVESLLEQPIVTSPRSFVVTRVIAVDRIDARLGNLVGDELVALALELPASPALESLLAEMRNDFSGNSKTTDLGAMHDLDDSPYKTQKVPPDMSHSDPDRVILGRMTNSQRILVGQTCAALKNRRINKEGTEIRENARYQCIDLQLISVKLARLDKGENTIDCVHHTGTFARKYQIAHTRNDLFEICWRDERKQGKGGSNSR